MDTNDRLPGHTDRPGHAEVESRLRALGNEPLPAHLAELSDIPAGHVAPLVPAAARSRWARPNGRRALVAAAAVFGLAVSGGVSMAALGTFSSPAPMLADTTEEGESVDESSTPAEDDGDDGTEGNDGIDDGDGTEGNDDGDDGEGTNDDGTIDSDDDGTEGNDGIDDGDGTDSSGDAVAAEEIDADEGEFPHLGDDCKGPPSWVTNGDEEPVDGRIRSAEARAHAERRASCERRGDADKPEESRRGEGRPDHAGAPAHAGPPAHANAPDHARRTAEPPARNGEDGTENGAGENSAGENGSGSADGDGDLDTAGGRADARPSGPPPHAGPPAHAGPRSGDQGDGGPNRGGPRG